MRVTRASYDRSEAVHVAMVGVYVTPLQSDQRVGPIVRLLNGMMHSNINFFGGMITNSFHGQMVKLKNTFISWSVA